MARPRPSASSTPLRRSLSLLIAVAFVAPALAAAAPAPVARPAATKATAEFLRQPMIASADGTATISVAVGVDGSVDGLQVRFRIRRLSGTRTLLQRTDTTSVAAPGTVSLSYVRSLDGLDLREGRYPVEVEVSGGHLPPVTLKSALYVVKPGHRPVDVVVLARFLCSPGTDPEGRFVTDPASSTERGEMESLVRTANAAPYLRLSIAVAPVLLDEWRRVASGYQTTGPEGLRGIAKGADTPLAYAATLETLSGAVRRRRLELLDVPFAEPDLAGLQAMKGLGDLRTHYERSASIYQAALGATPTAGTAILGDSVPRAAATIMSAQKLGWMFLKRSPVAAKESTPVSGVYSLAGSPMRALVIDPDVSRLLSDRASRPQEFTDALFARLTTSKEASQPLVAVVSLGPGAKTDAGTLGATLSDAQKTGWVRYVTSGSAARAKTVGTLSLAAAAAPGRPAPAGYWADVSKGQADAQAFATAAGQSDQDAETAVYDALVSESRCWAGPDELWTLADRGRAFASAAARISNAVLDKVGISAQNVTLSSAGGKVPISIRNDSGKVLDVVVEAKARNLRFPSGARQKTTLRPADNYVTIPVELKSGTLSGPMTVAVSSGDRVLATTTLDVRGSYLDRLALVGTVVLVLLVLLVYIRRKARVAEADNTPDD